MNREPIYAAAFALLQAIPGLALTDRKLQHWADVSPSSMPALFMAQGRQVASVQPGMPAIWDLEATAWVYVSTDGAAAPGPVINPILDAIEAAFPPDEDDRQTLGGLVYWARIAGTIETSEGTLGDREVARVPLKFTVTGDWS